MGRPSQTRGQSILSPASQLFPTEGDDGNGKDINVRDTILFSQKPNALNLGTMTQLSDGLKKALKLNRDKDEFSV